MEPKRLRILRALKAKLERIQTSNGFETDAGAHVALGRYRIGAGVDLWDALPAISVNYGRADTPANGGRVQFDLPVIMQALVVPDQEDPAVEAELVIGDIKRALFGSLGQPADETLGGLITEMEPGAVEPLPREEGSQFAGGQVEVLLKMTEKRGEPEN